jgi:hypothetical protein
MALDRWVYFRGEARPTREQLGQLLEDFFGQAGEVKWDRDRFFVVLVGKPSHPLKRMPGVPSWMAATSEEAEKRWIEVWMDEKCVDVMTRMSDAFTNALAHGLAELIARFWDGGLQEG